MGSEECMSGQQIYENFINGRGTDGLANSYSSLGNVSEVYNERVDQITRLAASMEECWTGNASGAAQRGAAPLAVAHGSAAAEMITATNLLERQAGSFHDARTNVVKVPNPPNEPSTIKKILTLGGAQDNYEDKVQASNAAAQRNVATMSNWASASSYNSTKMPTDYGTIDPNAMTVRVKEERAIIENWPPPHPEWPPKPKEKKVGGDDDKNVVGTGDGKDKVGIDDKTVRPPQELQGRPIGIDNELIPPPSNDDWRNIEPDKPDTTKPPLGGGKDDLTRPEDYTPPDKPGDRPGWNGTGGVGSQSSSGQGSSSGTGFGPLAGFGGSGSGAGSGSGSGRFGSGSGSGSGSGTGSASGSGGEKSLGGRGTGSASGAAEAMGRGGAAGARGAGAGGRSGTGGMPGMAPGQKGQGDEDEEHQRKYIVEDDEVFQLTDDGERLTDPRTGMPLTPPVIGE
jgi:hypothetical protein